MERNFKKDIERGVYSNKDSIASLIPYLLNDTAYALELNDTPALRQHVVAAIFKYENPDDCYEDILNEMDVANYSDEKSCSPHDMVIHIIIEGAITTSLVINNYHTWCSNTISGLGKELFFASMIRIVSSF